MEREAATLAQALERESRMARRMSDLENFVRNHLVALITGTTGTIQSLKAALDLRSCLLDPAKGELRGQV